MQGNLLKLLDSDKIGTGTLLAQLENIEDIRQLTEFVRESLAEMGVTRAAPILPDTLEGARSAAAEYISSCRTNYLDSQMPTENIITFPQLDAWGEDGELSGYRITKSFSKLLFPGFGTIARKDIRRKLFIPISDMHSLYTGLTNSEGYTTKRNEIVNYLGGLVLAPEDNTLLKDDNDEPLKVRDIIKLRAGINNYSLAFHVKHIPRLIERDLGIKSAPPHPPEGYIPLNSFVRCNILRGRETSTSTRKTCYDRCVVVLEKLKEDGKDIRIGRCSIGNYMNLYDLGYRMLDLFFHRDLLPEVEKATAWIKPSNGVKAEQIAESKASRVRQNVLTSVRNR